VLIVCEGAETEPTYFRDLCADPEYRLTSVDVDGSCDSNPLSVVEYGLREYREDGSYDRLYCVFDRDRHDGFRDAVERLRETRDPPDWDVHWTYSIPCFEYWILLHYTLTGRLFVHPDSPCGEVVEEIENYLPNFRKGMSGLYDETKDNLDTAMENARQRWGQARGGSYDDYNPRTKVHKLISYLQDLRS
jgi:hypothetical protein